MDNSFEVNGGKEKDRRTKVFQYSVDYNLCTKCTKIEK